MTISGRLVALILAGAALAMLGTGASLRPASGGISTHTQLGMAPCLFEIRTHLPCLSCGYTTSVSHFAHGQFLASLYLQPMGFVIALMASIVTWAGFYIAFTGRPIHRLLDLINGRKWLFGLLGFAIASWGWKILIRLNGLDHWP